MDDKSDQHALFGGLTRRAIVAIIAILVVVGCLSGVTTGGAILFLYGRQQNLLGTSFGGRPLATTVRSNVATPSILVTDTATAMSARTPTPIPASGSGANPSLPPTATPPPTFPPATPQPAMYSVSLVSKVYGQGGSYIGMNVQIWPPDKNAQLRISYYVCPSQGGQTSVIIPPWSAQGVGEVNLDTGTCAQQSNTVQLDITAYWTTGQTSHFATTSPISW